MNAPDDKELVRQLLPLWHAVRRWAEELLTRSFDLEEAQDILGSRHRGRKQIPGTNWMYCTHGVGVDIYRSEDVGGIDFDFDKTEPDEWRLRGFIERQFAGGNLPHSLYRDLVEDESRLESAVKRALGDNAT